MGGVKGVHFIKRVKRGGESIPFSIYKEYNKSKEKGRKRVKSCGKVYSSLYIEYIIEIYKGKQGAGQKIRNVRERVFLCI